MFPFIELPGDTFLWWLDLVATTLSFIGSFWMILCCLKAPSPKSLSLKLIAVVGISDFFYSVANLLSNFQNPSDPFSGELCEYEAILRQVSYTLSIFFSTCIAVASYKTLCPHKKFNRTLFFMGAVFLGLAISASYIFFVPGIFGNSIVISQGPFYCWFAYEYDPEILISTRVLIVIVFQGLPVFIGLIIVLISYILAINRMREISSGLFETDNINVYRVLWYPAVLFITFVPHVAVTMIGAFYEIIPPVWLNAIHLYLPHSIGFNNALLYGIQARLYKTNYEELHEKAGGLDDHTENSSYIEYTYYSDQRKSSVHNALKQAYSD